MAQALKDQKTARGRHAEALRLELCARFLPHDDNTGGFFVAKLKRKNDERTRRAFAALVELLERARADLCHVLLLVLAPLDNVAVLKDLELLPPLADGALQLEQELADLRFSLTRFI